MNRNDFYDNLSIVSKCPLFIEMSADEIFGIISSDECELRRFAEDTVLPSEVMYVVLEGSVLIEKSASDGRWITMSVAEPPAAINVAAVLEQTGDLSRLTVRGGSTVMALFGSIIQDSITSGGRFALNYVKFLTNRISFLNHKITSLAGYSASGRVLMYIQENSENGEVTIPTSLSDFADYLGVGRASLYRALDGLEEKKIIKRSGRRIRLL